MVLGKMGFSFRHGEFKVSVGQPGEDVQQAFESVERGWQQGDTEAF